MARGVQYMVAAFLLFCAGGALGDPNVLWWMVDSNASVSDGTTTSSIQDFFTSYGAVDGETSYYAARVKVQGGSITEDTFLDLYYYDDELGDFSTYDGAYGIDFGDSGSGYWGAGVPEGMPANIDDYNGSASPEYTFLVEIGHVVDDTWTTIATSEPSSYADLADDISTSIINPPDYGTWTPAVFTAVAPVPEPSSGLLLLIGSALLALRRRAKPSRRAGDSAPYHWGKGRRAKPSRRAGDSAPYHWGKGRRAKPSRRAGDSAPYHRKRRPAA